MGANPQMACLPKCLLAAIHLSFLPPKFCAVWYLALVLQATKACNKNKLSNISMQLSGLYVIFNYYIKYASTYH